MDVDHTTGVQLSLPPPWLVPKLSTHQATQLRESRGGFFQRRRSWECQRDEPQLAVIIGNELVDISFHTATALPDNAARGTGARRLPGGICLPSHRRSASRSSMNSCRAETGISRRRPTFRLRIREAASSYLS